VLSLNHENQLNKPIDQVEKGPNNANKIMERIFGAVAFLMSFITCIW
jgi:hypothetical protein